MFALPINVIAIVILAIILGLPLRIDAKNMNDSENLPSVSLHDLSGQLEVGDVVFTQLTSLPFQKVSTTTNSWTNHVGIVVDMSGKEPIIAESRVPLTKTTRLSKFVGRSKGGRVVVKRLHKPLSD